MLIIQFYVPQIRHLKSYHFIVYSKYNLVNVDEIKSSLFTISVSYCYAECMPSDDGADDDGGGSTSNELRTIC